MWRCECMYVVPCRQVGFLNFAWNVDLRVIFDGCTERTDILYVQDAEILKVMVHIITTFFCSAKQSMFTALTQKLRVLSWTRF
jgi:hypothetical protein